MLLSQEVRLLLLHRVLHQLLLVHCRRRLGLRLRLSLRLSLGLGLRSTNWILADAEVTAAHWHKYGRPPLLLQAVQIRLSPYVDQILSVCRQWR